MDELWRFFEDIPRCFIEAMKYEDDDFDMEEHLMNDEYIDGCDYWEER